MRLCKADWRESGVISLLKLNIMQKFFDKKGVEIKPFSVIKIFHFIGARRKRHYMYKWVQVRDGNLVALHLGDDSGDYFHLRSLTVDASGRYVDCEVVQ